MPNDNNVNIEFLKLTNQVTSAINKLTAAIKTYGEAMAGCSAVMAQLGKTTAETTGRFEKMDKAFEKTKTAGKLFLSLADDLLKANASAKTLSETAAKVAEPVKEMAENAGESAAAVAELGKEATESTGVVKELAEGAVQSSGALQGLASMFGITARTAGMLLSVGLDVIGMLVRYIASYDDGIQSAKELTTVSRGAAGAFAEIDKSAAESAGSIDATAVAANRYLDLLDELNAKANTTGLSSDEMELYRNLVGELNGLLPDVNASIDEQTGLLNRSTDAIRNSVDAWREQAKQQGQIEALTEKYKELGAVEVEYATNVTIAKNAEEKRDAAIQEHSNTIDRMNELMDEATAQAKAKSEELGYPVEVISCLSAEYGELENALVEYVGEMDSATRQMDEANKAAEASLEVHQELSAELEVEEEALLALADGLMESGEATDSLTEAERKLYNQLDNALSQMDALELAYQSAYEAARESIDGQISMFDTFSHEVTLSTQDMMDIWAEQAENLEKYNENMAFSSHYLSAELKAAWSDGSTESAGYIQAYREELEDLINTHGEESEEVKKFVKDFNDSYASTGEAKDNFADMCALMQTDYNRAVEAIQEDIAKTVEAMDMAGEAGDAANNTLNGMVETYKGRMGEIYDLGAAMGQKFMDGYNEHMQIFSPSRVAKQAAEYTMQGFEMRFDKGADEMEVLGANLGRQLVGGYSDNIERQQAQVASPFYDSRVTYNTGGAVTNVAEISVVAPSLSEDEITRLLQRVDSHFGGKTTVHFAGVVA